MNRQPRNKRKPTVKQNVVQCIHFKGKAIV
jgi:hypothetical protein